MFVNTFSKVDSLFRDDLHLFHVFLKQFKHISFQLFWELFWMKRFKNKFIFILFEEQQWFETFREVFNLSKA